VVAGTADTFRGFLPGRVIEGRYRLMDKLGEGGMGTVYKVEHTRMGKVMALKVLRPDLAVEHAVLERFRDEARIVSRLSHPNTISVFDFGELDDGNGLFIAMEYVQGYDLTRVLKTEGHLTERRAALIGVQVLRSLAEAHEAGIVHRDIKPGNVMVVNTRQGEDWVKVVDFGIAKLGGGRPHKASAGAPSAPGSKSLTGAAEFLGTPLYCSPEQARGEVLDARSDLYSVGAMLFELVCGVGPYEAATPSEVIHKHITSPIPSLRRHAVGVSEAFDFLLQRALAKDPKDRFQSADAMREALEAVVGGPVRLAQPVAMPSTGGYEIASRDDWDHFEKKLARSQTGKLVLGGAAVVAVFAGMAGGMYHQFTQPKPILPVTVEVEVNDDPAHANLIALDAPVTGSMGSPHHVGKSDIDVFELPIAQPGQLWVQLTGVTDLNLVLELIDAGRTARAEEGPFTHVAADDGRLSGGELLGPYPAQVGKYFLRVSERPAWDEPDPHRPPRERNGATYTLTAHLVPSTDLDEQEPNDLPTVAQKMGFEKPVLGHAGEALPDSALEKGLLLSAYDYYRAEAPFVPAVALVVQPPDRAMGLWDGNEIRRWEEELKEHNTRKAELTQKVAAAPTDKALAAALKKLVAPFLPAPVRANGAGVASLHLGAREGQLSVLVAPLSGASPTWMDAPYGIALANPGPGGLNAVISLARTLAADKRVAQAKALLQAALSELPQAPEAEQARALMTQLQ
jgi:serine/threonine-protein kinase